MLNNKEQFRLDVVRSTINGEITNGEASKILSISERQVKRLKASVRKLGETAVVHKLKGRVSNNFSGNSFKNYVLGLIKEKYSDFGPSFASEKLSETNNIDVNPETLRIWMAEAGIWREHKKKKGKYLSFRERKDYLGEMIQFDGSYHNWFEDRLLDSDGYPVEVCLLAGIDDATSQVVAKFDMNESVFAVFSFWKEYVLEFGKPLSIYLDKYSTYKINHKHAVDNFDLLTQFETSLNMLDIKMINANTPQAKGRVERLFGTLQDRLVKELRLNGISTIELGNKFLKETFLPKFNKQFSVIPNKKGDVHRILQKEEIAKLGSIFSIKSVRRINNDYTIQFKNQFFQLKRIQPTTIRQGETVQVEEWLGGKIKFKFREKYLNYFKLKKKPKKIKSAPLILTTHKTNWKPSPNHPWKKMRY
jgi:hypothetical protein